MECRKRKSENCEFIDDYYYLDPLLNISEDLYEMIFQHFCCQTIKNVSVLNRHWYIATAMSKVCMKRIRLQVDFKGPYLRQDLNVFFNSIRKYINMHIFCPNYFNLTEDCIHIIRCHANTLINLEVWGMNDDFSYRFQPLELPKLETLQLVDMEANAGYALLLRACSKLRVLNLLTSKYHPALIECLTDNGSLKELHFSRDVAFNLLVTSASTFDFQLDKFVMKANVKEGYSDERFLRFVCKQRRLKILSLFGVAIEVALKLMNDLPMLEELEYRSSPIRDYRPQTKCYPNSNIRILTFDSCFDSYSVLKNILDACHNLEQITLHTVPVELLNYIVITNMKLKRIYYKIDVDDVTQHAYLSLKLTNYDLNRDIIFIKY